MMMTPPLSRKSALRELEALVKLMAVAPESNRSRLASEMMVLHRRVRVLPIADRDTRKIAASHRSRRAR